MKMLSLLLIAIGCILILTALPAAAQAPAPLAKAPPVVLTWDYGDVPGVTFRLYERGANGEWVKVADIAAGREHPLTTLAPGLHTFVVRAVKDGIESPNSNELPVLAPPGGLRWSVTISSP